MFIFSLTAAISLLQLVAEQMKDEIVDDLLRVPLIRSKRQRVGESLGRKFRKI